MLSTLFLADYVSCYRDDVDNPEDSTEVQAYQSNARQNVLYRKVDSVPLDATATRTVTIPTLARAEWVYIIARVIGSATLNVEGVDTDDTTAVEGKLPAAGTALFPGFLKLSTYNLDSITLESHEDGTVIDLIACICCDDDDARLTTNA